MTEFAAIELSDLINGVVVEDTFIMNNFLLVQEAQQLHISLENASGDDQRLDYLWKLSENRFERRLETLLNSLDGYNSEYTHKICGVVFEYQ